LARDDAGRMYLKASSKGTCSGLFKKVEIAVDHSLVLSWEWRVRKFPSHKREGTPLTEKADCDFAARVCVVFAGDSPFSSHYIYYVWDDRYKKGFSGESSGLLKRTKILVVEDAPADDATGWATQQRNIYEDYQALFGEMSCRPFRYVGLLTDSDGTNTESAAEFRNIQLWRKVERPVGQGGDGAVAR